MSDKKIEIGSHVRWINSGEYAGKVTGDTTIRYLDLVDKHGESFGAIPEDSLELAPELTPEEAWAQASLVAVKYMASGQLFLASYVRRQIRHDIYKLLGGAKVKVTPDVKRQVVKIVRDVAEVLKVTILEPEED